MNKIKEFFAKLKSIKHFYVYFAVMLALVACAIYFSNFKSEDSDNSNETSTESCSNLMEYSTYLENKLCCVLKNLSGVGQVNVAITFDGDVTYEYATDTETKKVVSSGTETTVTSSTVIVVSNEPVVSKTIYPSVKGVVVVAEGASEIGVKLNILSAIETVLEVDPNNITILC